MWGKIYIARVIFLLTYIVKGTFLSNTRFEFHGSLFWFFRQAILKYYKNNLPRKENLVSTISTLTYIFHFEVNAE